MTWNPHNDGIDHINIYSKGKTKLGQMLSNFYKSTFALPDDGPFISIEGYWYWLSTKDDALRTLYGFEAKRYGREKRGVDWPKDPEFERKILRALEAKMQWNENISHELKLSSLPLVHYYVGKNGEVIEPRDGMFMVVFWMQQREKLQNNSPQL